MQMLTLCIIITVNTAEDDMLCHRNIVQKLWSSAGRMVTFVVTRQKHCNKGRPEYAAHLLF